MLTPLKRGLTERRRRGGIQHPPSSHSCICCWNGWGTGILPFCHLPNYGIALLATDGTIDYTGVTPVGVYSSVSPHSLHGWIIDPTKRFYIRGKGVRVFGAELVSIHIMELLPVVNALEQLPPIDACFYVDASCIL